MGQRLLIVDSDRRFIKEHQVALEASFDVDFLAGTDGVVQQLDSGKYAAVLICVEVSDNKGYALCSAIRKHPSHQNMKVGLISAKATEEEYVRHQSLKGRADLYLHKPIISSALISALGALVPPRAVDPDNPLGDIAGVDLGEEWLESLKNEIDSDIFSEPTKAPARVAAPPPAGVAPPKVAHPIPAHAAPSPDAGQLMLLNARVKDLENKLIKQDELLAAKDRELAELNQKHDAATQRLDDIEQQRVTTESHVVDRDKQIAALVQEKRALEVQIKELSSLSEQLESARGTISGLEQRIQELEPYQGEAEQNRKEIERIREESERSRLEAERSREELRSQMEARLAEVANRDKEFLALKEDYIGLEATLRGQRRELAEQVHSVNSLVQDRDDLKVQLDAKNKALVAIENELASKLAAKDAEYSSQLAAVESELKSKLAAKETEYSSQLAAVENELKSTLAAQELEYSSELAAVEKALTSQLAAKEAEYSSKLAAVEKDLSSQLTAAKQEAQELANVRTRVAELEEEILRITQDHEQQRNELLSGLEEREAQIGRLKLSMDVQLSQMSTLEKEKRELEGQLRERMARMDALTQALVDLEMGLKRASDLTRPF